MTDPSSNDLPKTGSVQDAGTYSVRTYVEQDADSVTRLSHAGLLPGYVEVDPVDLAWFEQSCRPAKRGQFWVAEAGGQVIGTVALVEMSPDIAQLRWLRVAPSWQAGHEVARLLVRAAVAYAREMGCLKLILHAPPDAQPQIVAYFHLLGFEFSRSTTSAGQNFLEFYLNLYEKPGLPAVDSPRSHNNTPQS